MVNYLFDMARAVFAAIVILFFLMLPEIIFGFVDSSFPFCWDPVKLGILLLLALSLSFVKSKRFLTCFLVVFGVLQLVQFGMIISTGRYVSVFDLDAFSWNGLAVALKTDVWSRYLILTGVVVVPYLMLEYIFSRGILNPPSFKKGWMVTVLFLTVFAGNVDSVKDKTDVSTPCCYAAYNTLNVSAAYLTGMLPQKIKEKWPEVSLPDLSAQAAEE